MEATEAELHAVWDDHKLSDRVRQRALDFMRVLARRPGGTSRAVINPEKDPSLVAALVAHRAAGA